MTGTNIEVARRTWWILAGILALALVVRISFALIFPAVSPDGKEYEQLAKNLLLGNGFSESLTAPFVPAVIREILYPVIIAGVYAVVGESHLALYVFQALVSTASIYFLFRIATRFFGERVGLIAALVAALYLPMIVYAADILTETMIVFFVAVGTYCFIRSEMRIDKWLVASGFVLGLAALTRSDSLLYSFALGLCAILFARNRPMAVRAAFVLVLVFGIVISPWMIRNYLLIGRPFLRDSAMTLASLSIGTGRKFSDPAYAMPFQYPGGMPPEVRQAHEKMVIENYLADVRNGPVGYLRTRATQLARMWMYGSGGLPVEKGDIGELQSRGEWGQFFLRLGLFVLFGPLMLVFAFAGALIGIRRNTASAILLVYAIYITLICLPLYADYRYSLSGQFLLLPFCALAMVVLWDRILNRDAPRIRMNVVNRVTER